MRKTIYDVCKAFIAVQSHQRHLSLIKTKIFKTTFFNKENISKLKRNKDSIKHVLIIPFLPY